MEQIPGPGTGQEKLQKLMERIYCPIIEMAKKHCLAIIDLPRTFNPSDETLYRLQIEPSKKGGELIAKVVSVKKKNIIFFIFNFLLLTIPF